MATISLAEAVKLKSVLSSRIHELEEEMDRVAFVEIEKDQKPPKQSRTLEHVENDVEEVRRDLRLLDRLMYEANVQNEVMFDETPLTIVEAIELATQLRAKARKYKTYASSSIEEYQYYGDGVQIVKLAMFDPEEYRLKALEAEKRANRLSNSINAKNYAVYLSFDRDKYF
ncbi:hypothetical protein [Priestia endophytica]|uniref:hypothetical protein n=1 Tax=Priestia endophytica TaxID=135735 RepID=UPI000DCA6DF9|nr:hypothetical protein [Priestia endophytica]RAS75844.1 hypothetical protein A4U60_19785 [Priestia endophytica]